MSASLHALADALQSAAGLPAAHAAVRELRQAAAELEATAAASGRWRMAVVALASASGRSAESLLARTWGLPEMPGVELVTAAAARAVLAGDDRLLGGRVLRLPLGPLDMTATLPAAIVHHTGGRPIVAGLLPPDGMRAALAAGPVRVDGGVARDGAAWAGALQGSIGVIAAGADAQLVPGGDATFVAVFGARFTPGIQLGFGFEITTLGGVVGVNVGTDVDALRLALSSGAATSLFFPTAPGDPGERSARLGLLGRVFPPRPGSVVAGPSAELTWLQVGGFSLLRLSVVALLELPRARVIVLGRADLSLPPVLHLRLDVLGEIDPPHGVVALDMAVTRGRVLGLLRVDGTMAMRIRTTEPTHALLTIGGFFPGYRSDVPGLPPQRRISMGPDLPLPITFRFEGYLAITDGTFQVGARVEIGFDLGVSVHGFLQFDAICQFDPFHIHARLAGGVDVGALGFDFGGVDFEGVFDGPGPVVVRGRVSVSVLGASAGWNDSFRLGDAGGLPQTPPITDLAGLVVLDRQRPDGVANEPLEVPPDRMAAIEGRDPLVDVATPTRDPRGRAIVPPLGGVRWTQTTAPFGIRLHRVGGRRLATATSLSPQALPVGLRAGPTELFSPAGYRDVAPETLLTLPAYERLPSGFEAVLEPVDAGGATSVSLDYEEWYRGDPDPIFAALLLPLPLHLLRLLGDRDAPAEARPQHPRLSIEPEKWEVRGTDGGGSPRSRTAAVFLAADTAAEGMGAVDVVAVPAGEPKLHVEDLWEER